MKKYFSVLLAAIVFFAGMTVTKNSDAAKVTADEVTRTVTIQPRLSSNETKTAQIKIHLMVENIDLHAYEKYTVELRKNAKYGNVVFAKAAPGSQVTITAEPGIIPGILSKPAIGMNCTQTTKFYNHKKIGTLKELTSLGKENAYGKKYTIPKDVEEVTATVSLTYHVGTEVAKDMKASTGTYRQEPTLSRHYYIFTSDEACKKAYELMTSSNSVTGAISSVLGGDKKSSAKSDSKQAGSTSDSKDSGGLGTAAKIGIGVAAVGAIGFGASRFLGKGSKGAGAGANSNSAGAAQTKTSAGGARSNVGVGSVRSAKTRPNAGNAGVGAAGATHVQAKAGNVRTNNNSVSRAQAKMRGAGAGGARNNNAQPARNAEAKTETAFCNSCGAPLRPGSRFCENCGAKTAPKFCPKCGEKLEEGSVFCGNCGNKL
ncbi:MAG: zinc ribbon domain-containing protein [Acidaminococcaceae bacterium]|nr:zinc ribbon domain-containing protein [Acidaminococcaceae bacterium]